jgi:acyl-ACP thioesterase
MVEMSAPTNTTTNATTNAMTDAMVPVPASGRVFRGQRPVRLADADPTGRLRFDACARYLHDLSNDDTRDAALDDDGSWVVRRTAIDVLSPLRFHERLSLATWCGGTGSRWAERRVSIDGSRGGRAEATSLWVYVDLQTMLPKRLAAGFVGLYGEAAAGRTIGSKLVLPSPPADADPQPWPLRHTDLDVLDHVNNAAYWCALEELIGRHPGLVEGPHRAIVEFAKPLDLTMDVALKSVLDGDGLRAWLTVDGTVHAGLFLSPR